MVARVQQFTVLLGIVLALAWLAALWSRSPAIAVAGALAVGLLHAPVLGLEFLLLRRFGSADPAPPPTASQLVRAWLQEIGYGLQVFCWRQPFRSRAIPDVLTANAVPARRGVVLVHGFVCNRGFWNPWLERLRQHGHPFCAVDLEPMFGPIESCVKQIDEAVRQVTVATGRPPVLVCHSMGGLAARAWLASPLRMGSATHVITIGSPHHGTWLARFSRTANGQQMRQRSRWLERLGTSQVPTRFTCWYSNCDNIVFPASTATLPGADNRLVVGVAHVALAFHPEVMRDSLSLISSV